MKVTRKKDLASRPRFGEIRMGDVFEVYDGSICIKIWGRDAVDLETGMRKQIGMYDSVKPLDAELVCA